MIRAALFALAFLAGPAAAQQDASEPLRIGAGIAEFAYGIYCPEVPERLEDAPGTAAGVVNLLADVPEIEHAQTIVPAALGVGFGVVLTAEEGRLFDPAIVTITHPPYPDSGIAVEQWVTTIDDLGPNLIGFSFELRSELVAGTWTFSASHDGQELFHIAFEVVPPGLLPDLGALCAGAFLS